MMCSRSRLVAPVLALAALFAGSAAAAQVTPQGGGTGQILSASRDDIARLARAEAAIGKIRDSIYKELAMPRNKKDESQEQLREEMQRLVEHAIHGAGLTDASYKKLTYAVAVDTAAHRVFDSVLVAVTGVALATQVQAQNAARQAAAAAAGTPGAAPVPVPAGPVGVHIGHVVNGFTDTPGGMGLLPIAMAEAGIAAQHATLGARTPGDLSQMQLHAGHVLHALDPSQIASGPGRGYGVKKGALGAASHIELAAKVDGASQNVITHSEHIATASKAAAARADSAVAVAKAVQAATTAADAAMLMSSLVSLTAQITAGFDANADGRIDWAITEGGLQQAQEHVTLMLRAEGLMGDGGIR